jgi:predicted HicB family RNase H-like nuclease
MLDCKGYHAKVEYRPDDNVLFGRVLDPGDTVVFEAERAADVEAAFHGAVDDYLDFYAEIGKDPDRPFSGRFNVRLNPDLHRAAAVAAESEAESINHFVQTAIAHEVERRGLSAS